MFKQNESEARAVTRQLSGCDYMVG